MKNFRQNFVEGETMSWGGSFHVMFFYAAMTLTFLMFTENLSAPFSSNLLYFACLLLLQ
jgi:hypothetical protein